MKKTSKVLSLVFAFLLLILITSCGNNYEVIFKDFDGTILKTETVSKGSNATPPSSPNNKEGYHFVGWDKSFENIEEDTIITAVYEIKYVLATDEDFLGDKDGEFVYIGDAEYVMIPEYIKGVKITKTSNFSVETSSSSYIYLFRDRNNIKGVTFETPENITSMSLLFFKNESEYLELDYLDTSNVEDMSWMFYESKATTLDLSNFDTSNVTDMEIMFAFSEATTLDLSSFDTSNVINMSVMFYESKANALDLSSFDTSSVTDMSYMFAWSEVTTLDLSSFDTSNVIDMSVMFYESKATTLDLSSFDTSNVDDMDMTWIFHNSQATLGYARNRKEAARFNYIKDIFVYDEKEGVDYIFFGTYPQTIVDDEALIGELNKLTQTNSKGYYTYKENEYAKVSANPYTSTYKFSNGETIISNEVYYFKVEPIKWLILEVEDGSVTLLADMILDLQQFYISRDDRIIDGKTIYANNYEYSTIIEWLNNDFYNKAFNDIDKEQVLKSFVDNSASTTASSLNEYVSNDTNDWVYLLSYQDVESFYFSINEEKIAKASDYAKAINIYVSEGYGSHWWLRSPNYQRSNYAHNVKVDGNVSGSYIFSANIGVRPALKLRLMNKT